MAFALATSRKALQVACKATGKKAAAKVRFISTPFILSAYLT